MSQRGDPLGKNLEEIQACHWSDSKNTGFLLAETAGFLKIQKNIMSNLYNIYIRVGNQGSPFVLFSSDRSHPSSNTKPIPQEENSEIVLVIQKDSVLFLKGLTVFILQSPFEKDFLLFDSLSSSSIFQKDWLINLPRKCWTLDNNSQHQIGLLTSTACDE